MVALAVSSSCIASFRRHYSFRLRPRNPPTQAAVSPSSSASAASPEVDLSTLESAINKVPPFPLIL